MKNNIDLKYKIYCFIKIYLIYLKVIKDIKVLLMIKKWTISSNNNISNYNKATVIIAYQYQYISKESLYITEIIYKYQSYWHIRNAIFSYQHPFKYITIRYPSSFISVYKIFLDLYYNNFGIFRNVYHSLGSIYIQFENMIAYQRKLFKNYFVFRFVLFNSNFNKFLQLFISEIKEFE